MKIVRICLANPLFLFANILIHRIYILDVYLLSRDEFQGDTA